MSLPWPIQLLPCHPVLPNQRHSTKEVMGEDRSKKANPFGVGFLPKCSSEETRGSFVDPGDSFPSPKETVHFRATGAGEKTEASAGIKPLSLLWLSYTTLECPFDNRCTITSGFFFSSNHALQQLSSLNKEKESAVSPTSIKALHTHTITVCHTWLIPGQHLLGEAEESEPLTGWIKLHPALCPVFSGTWRQHLGKSVRTGHACSYLSLQTLSQAPAICSCETFSTRDNVLIFKSTQWIFLALVIPVSPKPT